MFFEYELLSKNNFNSYEMIPISTNSRITGFKIDFFSLCLGKTVAGKSPEVLMVFSNFSILNLDHFDTNLMGAASCGKKRPCFLKILKKP